MIELGEIELDELDGHEPTYTMRIELSIHGERAVMEMTSFAEPSLDAAVVSATLMVKLMRRDEKIARLLPVKVAA